MDNAAFTIVDCTLIELPRIHNRAGNITAVQNGIELPFDVQRIYYMYDIPAGETRGAHGHKNLEQMIIAASGSFDITLDDGRSSKTVQLNKPYVALHVRPGIWRDITNFSSGAICLVLASRLYDEADYLRDYELFKQYKKI
jgi:dTDP-4-dehydrorhamnose 3,5-epimerase-like enzyme